MVRIFAHGIRQIEVRYFGCTYLVHSSTVVDSLQAQSAARSILLDQQPLHRRSLPAKHEYRAMPISVRS